MPMLGVKNICKNHLKISEYMNNFKNYKANQVKKKQTG